MFYLIRVIGESAEHFIEPLYSVLVNEFGSGHTKTCAFAAYMREIADSTIAIFQKRRARHLAAAAVAPKVDAVPIAEPPSVVKLDATDKVEAPTPTTDGASCLAQAKVSTDSQSGASKEMDELRMKRKLLSLNIKLTEKLRQAKIESIAAVSEATIEALNAESVARIKARNAESAAKRDNDKKQYSLERKILEDKTTLIASQLKAQKEAFEFERSKRLDQPPPQYSDFLYGSTTNEQPVSDAPFENASNQDKFKTIRNIFFENRQEFIHIDKPQVAEFLMKSGKDFAQVFRDQIVTNPYSNWNSRKSEFDPLRTSSDATRVPWEYSSACWLPIFETLKRSYQKHMHEQSMLH